MEILQPEVKKSCLQVVLKKIKYLTLFCSSLCLNGHPGNTTNGSARELAGQLQVHHKDLSTPGYARCAHTPGPDMTQPGVHRDLSGSLWQWHWWHAPAPGMGSSCSAHSGIPPSVCTTGATCAHLQYWNPLIRGNIWKKQGGTSTGKNSCSKSFSQWTILGTG